jgi:hypothetical protein
MSEQQTETPVLDTSILDQEIDFNENEAKEEIKKENKQEEPAKPVLEEKPKAKRRIPPIKPVNITERAETLKETTEIVVEEKKTVETVNTDPTSYVMDSEIEEKEEEEEAAIEYSDEFEELRAIKNEFHAPRVDLDDINQDIPIVTEEAVMADENFVMKEEIEPEPEEKEEEKVIKTKIYGGDGDTYPFLSSDNKLVTKLRKYNISKEKIKPKDVDITKDKNFYDQYMNPANSPLISRRITRVPLILSGYYAEVTAYNYGDLFGVVRNVNNGELKYLARFTEELKSLFAHISWVSFKPEGSLTFDEWIKNTIYSDLQQFWFGVYDATNPGHNAQFITCGSCSQWFEVKKTNKELNFALQKGLKPDFVVKVLKEQIPVDELKKTPLYKGSHTTFDKLISDYQYLITYGSPTILDTLEWLNAFETVLADQYEDFDGLEDNDKPEHNILNLFTHIKKLAIPTIVGQDPQGRDILSYIGLDATCENPTKRLENRKQILRFIINLPEKSFVELFTGKEIRDMLKIKGMIHMYANLTCPHCGKGIARVPLNMKDVFFSGAESTVQQIGMF